MTSYYSNLASKHGNLTRRLINKACNLSQVIDHVNQRILIRTRLSIVVVLSLTSPISRDIESDLPDIT